MSLQYKKNAYKCRKCNLRIITVDRDQGTTPFIIPCVTCRGEAESDMYRVYQQTIPTHEWYHPNAEEYAALSLIEQEHVNTFSLLLRKIEVQPHIKAKERTAPVAQG